MDDFRLIIEAAIAKAKSDANIKKYVKDIQDQVGKLNLDVKVSDKNIKSAIKQITSETGKLNDNIQITKIKADSAQKSLSTFIQSLKPSYVKNNTQSIRELNNALDQVKQTGNKTDYSKATASLQNFKNTAKEAGAETSTLTQVVKDNIGAFTNWYLIGGAVSGLIGNFKEAIATIKEVDTLLTEISKTSNLSGDALKQLGINAFDYASKYGNTVQSYLSGYLEMSRGTDTDTAKGLAELSILAQSAGSMTAELANSYIVATNAAFKLGNNVSKLNEILDGQNQITNRNQVSMSDLAMATSVAGSQAAESGVAVNQMTAAMGTMIASTKQGGEVAGRAFKGILMNLQQVSGEIDGEVFNTDSFKKVEAALNDVGVATEVIVDGTAKLRDPIETLKELASVYNSLPNDSVEKANIIANLGGKYRGNQLAALLSNWKTYEKMLSDYQNSAGSAEAEAIKTANSIEGRLNKLSNTWDKTVANVVDSDMLKTFVSIGTGAIELTDDLDVLQTTLIGLGGFGSYKALTSLVPMLKNAMSSTIAFGNALNTVNAANFVADTSNLTKAIQGLTLTQATAVLSTKSLDAATIEATMTQAGFSVAEAKTTASTLTMSTANGVATASTLGLGASFKALTAAMMANPVGLIIAGVTVAISALSFGINKYKEAQEEALTVSKELTQTYKDEQSSIDSQINKYKELQKQLEQGNLSTEEATSIKSQLLDIQSNLTSSFGDEASGLDLVNGKYKDQINLLSELSKQKAQDYLAENRSGFNTAKNQLSKNRTYDLGMIGNNIGDSSLIDYIKKYNNDNVKLTEYSANGVTSYYVAVTGAVKEADDALHQLYVDVENVGKNTGANVSNVLNSISAQLNKTWTDDLRAYKDTYDEYIKAQVVENDTLRPLYIQSIDAIDAYNSAIANGNGINEAKANLDSIREKVNQNISAVEGSQNIFDNLFSTITSDVQSFKNNTDEATSSTMSFYNALEVSKKYAKSLSETLSEFQNTAKTLEDTKSEIEELGYISTNTLSNLISKYPKLGTVVAEYNSGLASTTDVLAELTNAYNTDFENYKQSVISKLGQNEEFYNGVVNNLPDWVKNLAESYEIDFQNFKSLQEAKLAISKEIATKQALLKPFEDEKFMSSLSFGDKLSADSIKNYLTNGITDIQNIISGVDTTVNANLKIKGYTPSKIDTSAKDKAKKAAEEAEKKRQEAIQKVKDNFAKEDDANKFLLDTGKIDESEYYKRLQSLNKKYFEGEKDFLEEDRQNQVAYYKWSQDQAKDAAKKQEDIAENLKDKYTDLISDIADEIEKEKDTVLDSLEKSHESIIESLEKEKEDYKDIVETQLELLDAKKKQADYEKSIADKTKDISKIEARKLELEKAAKSGDRTAIAELAKLDEELASKKEDLSDEQSDHELDLQKESLNNALDLNDKLFDARINAENSRFETQKENIETLYNKEIELINKAAQYTKTEFSKALDEIATELSSNGITQSSGYLGSIKQTQSSVAGSEINTSTSNRSAILAILSNGTGKDYGNEASALNTYVRDTYGAPISNAQAAQIASMLGVSGVNSADDIKGNDKNKNKLLEALRKAGFGTGGYVNTSGSLSSLIKQTGEDGIALVRHGEPILTVEQGRLFKELVGNLQPLNNLVKLSTPNISNLVTNNNSSPSIQITIPITGNADAKTVSALNSSANNIAQQVAKAIIDVKRTK